MTVALAIYEPLAGSPTRLVPVATEDVFRRRWMPGAEALGLQWIPMMSTGFDVDATNRGLILAELRRLRRWMEEHLGPEVYELERLDRVARELEELAFESGATAFLG